MIDVRPVTPADWRLLRAVRLAALRDAPYAFSSTHAGEQALGDRFWQDRTMDRAWFLAWHGREPVGIVAGDCDPAGPGHERHIVSMWVAPAARGTGAAQALMTAVTGWARQQGVRTVRLWVTDSSARARAFYQRSGFSPTGERQPVDTDPDTAEAEFRMDFDAAGPPAAMSPAAPSRGVGRTTGR